MTLNLEQRVMKDDWWFILTTIDLLLCSIALAKPPSSLALAYADSPDTNAPQNRHGPSPSCAQIILPQLRQFPIKSCFWALNQILYIVRWRTRDSGDSEDLKLLTSDQGWKWGHEFVRASIRINFTPRPLKQKSTIQNHQYELKITKEKKMKNQTEYEIFGVSYTTVLYHQEKSRVLMLNF